MTLGLGLLSYVLLIAPYVHDQTLTLLPKLVSIAYPIGDIILLAAVIRLAVDTGTRRPAFYLLIASIGTLFTTDFAYGIVTLDGSYHHQLSLDVGWILFYLLWGAAALHPSMNELSEASPRSEQRFTPFRLVLLAGATLIAPVLEIIKAPAGRRVGPHRHHRRLDRAVRPRRRPHVGSRAPAREVRRSRARADRRRRAAGGGHLTSADGGRRPASRRRARRVGH